MATLGKKDIKVTASDALKFKLVVPRPPKKRWGLRSFLLLMVAGGSIWGWQNYGEGIMTLWDGTDGDILLVRAVPGPVKVRPENPGGLRIPDRDKMIYNLIQGKNGNQEVARGPERLLPPPEQPLPKPGAETAAKTESGPQAEVPERPEKVLPKAKPARKTPTPKTKPVAKVPTVKDVAAAKRPVPPPPPAVPPKATSPRFSLAKRTPRKEEAKAPAPAKKAATVKTAPTVKPKTPVSTPTSTAAPPAPTSAPTPTKTARATQTADRKPMPRGRAYLVQLAAARSREGAEGEWNRLRARNLDLLGDLRLTVTKADLGPEKGVFYRLRAGPLADEPSARRLCSRLSTRQVGCLIIKPGQ